MIAHNFSELTRALAAFRIEIERPTPCEDVKPGSGIEHVAIGSTPRA
jgi:hypothetical protein